MRPSDRSHRNNILTNNISRTNHPPPIRFPVKTRSILTLSAAAVAFGAAFASRTLANTDLYWDADGGATTATGGTGTWATGTSLWRLGSSTGTLQAYDNTSPSSITAQFGGTAGTVTVSGTLNVGSLTFGTTGYTLTGGTLNLVPSTSPFVYRTNGGTTTINSTITSAGGTQIQKTGAGTLVIGTGGGGTSSGSVPALYTVTGGTFNNTTGVFDSILSMPAGNRLGVQATTPTTVLTLDAGTFQVTTATGNALAVNRKVQVNAAGGAISDFGSNNFYEPAMVNNAGPSSSLYLSNISGITQFRGAISGTGSVTWYGAGTASFQATNSYSGGTVVKAGTLQLAQTGALGSGALTFSGNGTIQSGAANLNLSNNILLGTTSDIIDTNGNTLTLSGSITNSAATDNALKAAGTGTLVLAGTFNVTGHASDTNLPALMLGNRNGANFNRGTVTITGTGSISRISTGWDNTANVLNFASSGTVTMATDLVSGQSANGVGVVNVSSGTLNLQNLNMANWDGAYGGFTMSGGTINATNIRNGGTGNGNGNSYSLMTGGTINVAEVTTLSRQGTGTNILHLNGAGAVFNEGNNRLNVGFNAGSTGIVTVDNGLLTVASNLSLAEGGTGTTGIVNLNGGIIRPNVIIAPNAAGTSIVNFNGGTLQARISTASFMGGLTAANIYSGGAKIDTNGKDITISQALQPAAGSGVSNIQIATGGAGYLGIPVVKITGGGGTGATAVAVMSGGVVTGIQITSAGTGYTSAPTVALVGGGATSAATLGTISLAANAGDGGLTKSGSGTLTLSGASTYTGATIVAAGVLAVNGSLGNTAVTVQPGATLAGAGLFNGPVTMQGTHSPGNSPGLQTFSNGLAYTSTSSLIWELNANSTATRGTNFDGIDVTGGSLSVATGSVMDLVFSGGVDFTNTFWSSNHSWTVIDLNGGTSGGSTTFTLGTVGLDPNNVDSSTYGSFTTSYDSGTGDHFLVWTIPEPSALGLALLALALGLRRRREWIG